TQNSNKQITCANTGKVQFAFLQAPQRLAWCYRAIPVFENTNMEKHSNFLPSTKQLSALAKRHIPEYTIKNTNK
ncbi:1290_t:CDS:2, partial [Dentiscutata heterogama]